MRQLRLLAGAALVMCLALSACTETGGRAEPSSPPPATPGTSTDLEATRRPPSAHLTADSVRSLPVAQAPQAELVGSFTSAGLDGANPTLEGVTVDGRVFVEHGDIDVRHPNRLRLNGVSLVDPVSGRAQILTEGFPHRSQVISMDSEGPWVSWVEGDSIYLDFVGWHLYAWNTRTGEHRELANFHDVNDTRGTPEGDYTVATWRGRAWIAAADRSASRQQSLYSVPLAGGTLRHEADNEGSPLTAGNRLITLRAGTPGITVLERSDPQANARLTARTKRRVELFAAGNRLVWVRTTPEGPTAQVLRPDHGPHTLFTGPKGASYWFGGDGYLGFHVGGFPHVLGVYSIRTGRVFRVTKDMIAYGNGGATNLLAWSPPDPPDARRMPVTVVRIGR